MVSEVRKRVFMSSPPKQGIVGAAGTGSFSRRDPSDSQGEAGGPY
jgi:hypothetical protein